MATPSYRQRVGKIEIDNKERELRKKTQENKLKEQPITEEEHRKRVEKLKELGLLK